MTVKNRFAAANERDAEDQLKALYGTKPLRTGSTKTHRMTWFVKRHQAVMARSSTHKNGKGDALFIVEVK